MTLMKSTRLEKPAEFSFIARARGANEHGIHDLQAIGLNRKKQSVTDVAVI